MTEIPSLTIIIIIDNMSYTTYYKYKEHLW